jgi:hypothetical protein
LRFRAELAPCAYSELQGGKYLVYGLVRHHLIPQNLR